VLRTGFGLLGDLLLIPLLERVRGLDYLYFSVIAELLLYPGFLALPNPGVKLALVGLLGLFNSGWYAVLQGNLYSSTPRQSGTAMALKDISGVLADWCPWRSDSLRNAWALARPCGSCWPVLWPR
jgi:FSR family fosmidomycin resistance protein-like MFS transporter